MRSSFLQRFGVAVLVTLWLVWGSNVLGNFLVRVKPYEPPAPVAKAKQVEAPAKAITTKAAEPTTTKAAEPTTPAAAPTKSAKPTAKVLAMLASADPAAGKKIFRKCRACHTGNKGGKNKVGPNLWNVVGRPKGAAPGFRYSAAIAGLGGTWTYEALNAFLTNPRAFAKGTKMTFPGVKNPADRAALIAYLRTLSDSPKPLP